MREVLQAHWYSWEILPVCFTPRCFLCALDHRDALGVLQDAETGEGVQAGLQVSPGECREPRRVQRAQENAGGSGKCR